MSAIGNLFSFVHFSQVRDGGASIRARLLATLLLLSIALVATGCQENAKSAIPRLTKELQSSDTHTRNKAALSLAGYGRAAEPAVPALIGLLRDPNNGVKSSAAYALREIGGQKAEAALEKATAEGQK